MNHTTSSIAVRIAGVAVIIGALLVPAASSRERTMTVRVPKTMMRTVDDASRVVRFDFPATHLVFSWRGPEGSGIEYREIDAGGRRSAWIPAGEDDDNGAPGEHETGVLSTSARASAVEWRPATGEVVRAVTIDYLNTIDGPATTRVVPAPRAADAATPVIVSREEWGADESINRKSGSCKRAFAPVQQLFVHHTAGSNSDTQDSAATMRAIYAYHVKSNGWCDVGYNFVVGRDGRLYEGRWAREYTTGEVHSGEDELGRGVIGAHVAGYNTGSVGVSLMGNFELQELPQEMRTTLVDFLAWESERHGLDPTGKHTYTNGSTNRQLYYVAAHRDAGSTACPGKNVYKIMPEIRQEAKNRMTPRATVRMSLTAAPGAIDHGGSADISGTLTDTAGVPVAGKEVALLRSGGGAWKVKERFTTGLDGSFTTSVKPGATLQFQADFAGDEALAPATSPIRTIAVRHVVTAFVEGGVKGSGEYVRFPPKTKSVVLYGWGRPAHNGVAIKVRLFRVFKDGSKKRIRIDGVTLSGGEWRYAASVPSNGRYRAIARFNGDDRHALGKSDPVLFRVKKR